MDILVFLAVLAAALMHAAWNAVIRIGLDRFAGILLLAMVQSGIALCALPFVAVPRAEAWPYVAAAAVLHTGYKLFLIRAYAHGDLAQVYPLARGTAPLIVAVVGALALGERIGLQGMAAVTAIGVGVVMMAAQRGQSGRMSPAGLAYAFGTAGFVAAYTLTDAAGARVAGDSTGFAMWMFVIDGIGMAAYALATRGAGVFRTVVPAWREGTAAGALSLGSYWIAIWAFTQAPVALVASLRETSVLFAMLIGVVFLRERVGPWRWAAAVCIVAGVVTMRL